MASTYSVAVNPATVIRDVLRELNEVEQVFVYRENDCLSVLAVMDQKNHDAMRRLFAKEAEIVAALTGMQVNFDLVLRCGRPLSEVVSPRGTLLFAR